MPTSHKSYCRFCHAYCAIEVDIEAGRALAIRGDTSDPMYGGYTCIKGRQLPERHHGPGRIREALKRTPEGGFETLPTRQALDEHVATECLKRLVPCDLHCGYDIAAGLPLPADV